MYWYHKYFFCVYFYISIFIYKFVFIYIIELYLYILEYTQAKYCKRLNIRGKLIIVPIASLIGVG